MNTGTNWQNLNGESVFDHYLPYCPTVIESVYNVSEIPEGIDPFITVVKTTERLFITDGKHGIYCAKSEGGKWTKSWDKI